MRGVCMKTVVGSSVVVAAMALSATSWAHGPSSGEPICRSISASLSATFFSEGCESAVGLCTAGDLLQRGGRVVGSTSYVADGIGGGVIGEDSVVFPPVEPATTWTYAGVLTLITPYGELQSTDAGILDNAAGIFTEFNRVQGGTGIFEGASGTFYINGTTLADGSGFDAEITGEVCVTNWWSAMKMRRVFLP
ncbi:hypothetical protein FRC98_10370 [Lujinxingia vulgaris]|uniref:Uncharacterized protein n=1 Tax=Lujinxingia vulgaris TaxID=2600176 RepID=A0A5C6XCX4_9DELT|nr:hypothetical protein [Lujinxingia vulgaris]TXD37131.1 hypothetical protein FRC98_10370 [Lujinxingia vulgaris]